VDSIGRLEERIDRALEAGDPTGAAALLERALAHPQAADLYLPELYERLGGAWRAAGRYDDAIPALERAIEAGWNGRPDLRSEIAELHLLAGREREAVELWARVKADDPDDVWLYNHVALSYGDLGRHEEALAWLEQGLELALRADDPARVIDQLLDLRERSLCALGRGPGELDRRGRAFLKAREHEAADTREGLRARNREIDAAASAWLESGQDRAAGGDPVDGEEPGSGHELEAPWQEGDLPVEAVRRGATVELAVGWFPEPDYAEALERWDTLRVLWGQIDHREYCRRMEATLRGWSLRGLRPKLVELRLSELISWCEERGLDPDDDRASFAADELRGGKAAAWPPSRNEQCWCGSGTKYKKCCGAVTSQATHPLWAKL
jgi:tetratricopeptide (TPR) repeat protein